jgi:hypothetical protein
MVILGKAKIFGFYLLTSFLLIAAGTPPGNAEADDLRKQSHNRNVCRLTERHIYPDSGLR